MQHRLAGGGRARHNGIVCRRRAGRGTESSPRRPTSRTGPRRLPTILSPCMSTEQDNCRPPDAAEPPRRWEVLAAGGLLLLAVGLIFGQTATYQFINLDDNICVYDNPQVTGGLTADGVAWAFTHRYAGSWVPLTWISHMLDWQLYRDWAGGHHLTNVLLARRHNAAPLPHAAADDRPVVAQRPGGGAVCGPSAAGRVGGLGDGAEGRAERPVLHAGALGLRGLRAQAAYARAVP